MWSEIGQIYCKMQNRFHLRCIKSLAVCAELGICGVSTRGRRPFTERKDDQLTWIKKRRCPDVKPAWVNSLSKDFEDDRVGRCISAFLLSFRFKFLKKFHQKGFYWISGLVKKYLVFFKIPRMMKERCKKCRPASLFLRPARWVVFFAGYGAQWALPPYRLHFDHQSKPSDPVVALGTAELIKLCNVCILYRAGLACGFFLFFR